MKFNQIRNILLIGFVIFVTNAAFAQHVLRGRVVDELKFPILYAKISLCSSLDSTVLSGVFSDDEGQFLLPYPSDQSSFIKITASGYAGYRSENLAQLPAQDTLVVEITLQKDEVNFQEVAVVVTKKNIAQKNGTLVVDLKNNPMTSGNSVFDVLSKLPGVLLDNNGNIQIQGRKGAKIWIDEQLVQLSGPQLVNLLKNMSADNLENIEIIKNPSAKYDASGTVGLISIHTKQNTVLGFNGSLQTNVSQGFYARSNHDLTLNYKAKKVSFYSSAGFNRSNFQYSDDASRDFANDLVIRHNYVESLKATSYNFKFGMDWNVNSKSRLGFSVEGNATSRDRYGTGKINIEQSDLGYDFLHSINIEPDHWKTMNYNLNWSHLFDTLGTALSFSADYNTYLEHDFGSYENRFFSAAGEETEPATCYKNQDHILIDIFASTLDFKKNIFSWQFESGFKLSNQNMSSDYFLENKVPNTELYELDSVNQNKFTYHEENLAAYVNCNRKIDKVQIQFGLRGELTRITGQNSRSATLLDRAYSNLFPNLSLEYSQSKKQVFLLTFNRRINRPKYYQLNAFKWFFNPFISGQGNPFLFPEYSNTVDLSHQFDGKLSNSLSYSRLNHPLTDFTTQQDSSKESNWGIANLELAQYVTYNLFFQAALHKSWNLNINGTFSYATFEGTLGQMDIHTSGIGYGGTVNNDFAFSKTCKLQLQFQYFGSNFNGFMNSAYGSSFNVAVKKSYWNENLVFVLAINDLFDAQKDSYRISDHGQVSFAQQGNDTQRIRFSASYHFGKSKVQELDLKSNKDEKSRLKH